MNKINRDSVNLLEAFREAEVVEPIINTLIDGGAPRLSVISLGGTPIFNAYTKACGQASGPEPLAEKQIDQPKNIGQVGRMVISLINSSLENHNNTDYEFNRSSRVVDVCRTAEQNFIDSVRETNFRSSPGNSLFVDENGETVLFQKAFGEPSAISLKPISVGNVEYAKGTLFAVWQTEDAFGEPVDDHRFPSKAFPLDNIAGLQPMRLSHLALGERDKDRQHIIKMAKYRNPGIALGNITVDDIAAFMPSATVLKQLIQERPKLTQLLGKIRRDEIDTLQEVA